MKQKFTAEIKKHEGINGAYIEIPFDVEKTYGAPKNIMKVFLFQEKRNTISG